MLRTPGKWLKVVREDGPSEDNIYKIEQLRLCCNHRVLPVSSLPETGTSQQNLKVFKEELPCLSVRLH